MLDFFVSLPLPIKLIALSLIALVIFNTIKAFEVAKYK